MSEEEEELSIREILNNIRDIKVTTSYPLLLRLFDARSNDSLSNNELHSSLKLLESFIVRRSVCGIPTNPLNKLFIQLARNLPDADCFSWLQSSLSAFSGTSRFPKDAEFSSAFVKQPQYDGRATTRFILCRIEESFGHKESVDLSKATIEHVMPQTLSQKWIEELGSEATEIHSRLLHTFGNLTLTGYNPELGNLSFSEKKVKLETTHIELNRQLLEQGSWGAIEIEERAERLLLIANEIWMSPTG